MNEATQQFIKEHRMEDVRQLALRGGGRQADVDMPMALQQIAGWQVARKKLPSWAEVEGIIYPPHLNMEQCSSEQTAKYKETLTPKPSPSDRGVFVDLTGGFGVDFSFMSRPFRKRIYVERNPDLCEIARHNFQCLDLEAEVVCAEAEGFLKEMSPADVIFLDPARRDQHGSRTYGIEDCSPNVIVLLPLLREKANCIILKLSPMLDWRKAVSDVGEQYVREVHIVSVHNECKELLLLLGQGEGLRLVCANDGIVFEVDGESGGDGLNGFEGEDFLYEPNASIMKAGCFAELSQRFGIRQIAPNSHLFVSDSYVGDFPGRTFRIDAVTSLNKRDLKEHLRGISQANIAVRNFPLSVAGLRKRLKLGEGGSTYIFATTLASGEKVLLVCSKG